MIDEEQLSVNGIQVNNSEILEQIRKQGLLANIIKGYIIDKELETIEVTEKREEELLEKYMLDNDLKTKDDLDFEMKQKKIDKRILIDILSRPEKVVKYRSERWGEQINTLYLQNKEKYNLVTYNLLEANDIDVMYEVHFRIKDKEETWSDIAKKFPGGNQSSTARFGPIPVSQVDERLLTKLKNLKVNEVSKPFSYRNRFAIAGLIKFEGEKLNNEIKADLLRAKFENWINEKTIKFMNNTQIINKAEKNED